MFIGRTISYKNRGLDMLNIIKNNKYHKKVQGLNLVSL